MPGGAPAEIPHVVLMLKTAGSLGNSQDDVLFHPLFKPDGAATDSPSHGHTTPGAVLERDTNFSVDAAFAVISSQIPFLPVGLPASACFMSPPLASPDTTPTSFPKN